MTADDRRLGPWRLALRDLAASGAAVLLASDDPVVVDACDRVVEL